MAQHVAMQKPFAGVVERANNIPGFASVHKRGVPESSQPFIL